MIEQKIKDYLDTCDLGAPVLMEIPKNPPSEFFIVEKTGSAMNNHIYQSTIAIQSYASSLYAAASANDDIKDAMLYDFVNEPEITKVELNSDYNYTDTQSKKYRYQAVFDVTHY